MPSPPDPLVTPALLSRFGVPSAFLAQFAPRTFNIQIAVPGALGVMQFIWQYPGDSAWSAPIVSVAGTTWAYTLDDTFADLVFGAATYGLGDTYAVDAAGVVTGPSSHITATRFDLRVNACSAATSEALMLMEDSIEPPLLTWGDDARTHTAAWAYAILKRGRGLTPPAAEVGDQNVLDAERVAKEFFRHIGEKGRPDSMTDSSVSVDGPMFAAFPTSDPPRGW
jgi:hypothetical protein